MPKEMPATAQTIVVLVRDCVNGDRFEAPIPATAIRPYKACVRAKFVRNGKTAYGFFRLKAGSDGCHYEMPSRMPTNDELRLFDTAEQATAFLAAPHPLLFRPPVKTAAL